MKRNFKRGLGGVAVMVTLIATSTLSGYQFAIADETLVAGGQEIVILDGPGLLETPTDPVPPLPPREGAPTEPPVFNPGLEPSNPPVDAPREPPAQTLTPTPVASPIVDSSPVPSEPVPVQDAIETFGAETKPVTDASVPASQLLAISIPALKVSAPMALGSNLMTAAAKASLAKIASSVILTGRPTSISVKTSGTTTAKATAQAKAIVAELKKRGVAAFTVIKRVGNKTSVSVLVTKKP